MVIKFAPNEDVQIATQPVVGVAIPDLGGARYLYPVADNVPDMWEAVQLSDIDELLQDLNPVTRGLHVLGVNDAQIEDQLAQRYPCPIPDASYFVGVDDYELRWLEHGSYRKHWRARRLGYAWVRLKHPYVAHTLSVLEAQHLSEQHGAFYVPDATAIQLFPPNNPRGVNIGIPAAAEAEGFTATERPVLNLWLINYNKMAFDVRDYQRRRRDYERRTAGELPKRVKAWLYHYLTQWPRGHDQLGNIANNNSIWRYGPRHVCRHDDDRYNGFSLDQILTAIKVARKLFPKNRYYRNGGVARYNANVNNTYEDIIKLGLEYVHSCEDETTMQCDGPELLTVCRFLRAEARALHIRLPRKPEKPLTPRQLLQRRQHKKVTYAHNQINRPAPAVPQA